MKVSDLIMRLDDAHSKVGDVEVRVYAESQYTDIHRIVKVSDGEDLFGNPCIKIFIG